MSGLQTTSDDRVNGVDVREQGSPLRVASNTPHSVSLGTGRLNTAVPLHPVKQGPTYLRFGHPEEAELMKSVLPRPSVGNEFQDYSKEPETRNHQKATLNELDHELNMTIKEISSKKKPPAVPKKPFRDHEFSDSNSDQESRPKMSSIMAKVSKFEYYAKNQQKTVSRSQFYTNEYEISPKVFTSNSLTVNTPAMNVLGKNAPSNYQKKESTVTVTENNSIDSKTGCYANVTLRNRNKIDEIVRNFDESFQKLPKKVNNDRQNEHIYGKINVEPKLNNNAKSEGAKENVMNNMKNSGKDLTQYMYNNASSNDRSKHLEIKRNKAYQDRIKEEEDKATENARLEEILNICAEYEKQVSTGSPVTPTEKRQHNKIITNGSLPRGGALGNPNFVQTTDGYYIFDTSHNRNNAMSRSLPIARNVSSYENIDVTQVPNTPEHTKTHNENSPKFDEIGIPVLENNLSSPIMIKKLQQNGDFKASSPIGSPYENVYNRGLKPKSPTTQSPRSRIKTTFAHKNLPSPQYFVFPTPPPVDNSRKPNFIVPDYEQDKSSKQTSPKDIQNNKASIYENITPKSPRDVNIDLHLNEDQSNVNKTSNENSPNNKMATGIEKQLSLEEDIPMIDDASISNDLEFRSTKPEASSPEPEVKMTKNKSFDDVRKELMADIPELDEFEKDLKENRDKVINNIKEDMKKMSVDIDSIDSLSLNENVVELREKYEMLKENRRKLVSEIHDLKCKMTEIRSQEDDILRELEMEKALIKGEYDSEIAILNIEQKKKMELQERAKQIEDEIKKIKERQDARQKEMKDRVGVATLKVERLEKDVRTGKATMEELQNAQDILDNETKMIEDLEFQHLEEESELLANREDLQSETAQLTKKIEAQKTRILTLKSEANSNLTSALDETKVLHAEYVKLLNKVEKLTIEVQFIEKDLKPLMNKLNDIERTQSPDSAFFTDQTRIKSGEFGYSPNTSDEDFDVIKLSEQQTEKIQNKLKSIDQMSQSMMVDIERRDIMEIDDSIAESPKTKKGFWERNFDSLSRKKKKPKSPEKVDIMSQSLNENMFYNNENIETEPNFDKFNSLRSSKKKSNGPLKSQSSSKIPTFAALGKIIKKDSFGKRKENPDIDEARNSTKNRYVKNGKIPNENKHYKKKDTVNEPSSEEKPKNPSEFLKMMHRKSCGDEPSVKNELKVSVSGRIPSQDDIDRISKVTTDAPILSSDTDMNSLGKKTVDSLKEIERNRLVMLEEQGCQVIENEREKISELKRRVQTEAKKMYDEKKARTMSFV